MTFIPAVAHSLMSHGGNDKHDPSLQTYVADTLTSGSHPGSNMPGRPREDDSDLVAFHMLQDPVSDHDSTPAWGTGSKNGTASIAVNAQAGVRRLTPVECERLQGLPDGWTDPHGNAPDSRRYAALGDAVTANVAEWIGRRLLAHVKSEEVVRVSV